MKLFSLIDIFNEQVSKSPFENDKSYIPKPRFKPSALGSPCLRKIYYSYLRVTEDFPFPLKNQRICRLGDNVHDMLSSAYRKQGVLIDHYGVDGKWIESKFEPGTIDYEFPVKDADLEMSAKIDAILLLDQKLWVGEWKSINSCGFGYLKGPKADHFIQANLYYFLFKHALTASQFAHIAALKGYTDVAGIKFLYVNKDNSEMKEYTVEPSEQSFLDVLNKIQTIKDHCNNNTLPPKADDWCKSCSWRIKCKTGVKSST